MVMLILSLEGIRRIGEDLQEEPTIKNPENPIYNVTNGNITFKLNRRPLETCEVFECGRQRR